MDTAAELLAIEEIKALMARRLRAMDCKDWALYDTCHAPDAVLKSFNGAQATLSALADDGGVPTAVGKDAILGALRELLDGDTKVTTVHHAHTPEIVLTGAATATGVWAMEDRLWWWDDGVEQRFHGWGHYHETYARIGGAWLIASRTLTRLRTVETPDFFRYLARARPPSAPGGGS